MFNWTRTKTNNPPSVETSQTLEPGFKVEHTAATQPTAEILGENKIEDDEVVLKNLAEAMAYTPRLIPLDCMICITDREKFVGYYPGKKIDVGARVGDAIPPGDIVNHVLRTGREISDKIPKEVYGVPFKATVVPIVNRSGRVIGTIGLGMDLSNQEELSSFAEQLASSSEEVSASAEEMASSSQELLQLQQQVVAFVNSVNKDFKSISDVLTLITNVADETKLLGLNAAIEAARAGEQGRGFQVVAEEIRKLSEETSKSVKDIQQRIEKVLDNMQQTKTQVENVEQISQNLASAAEQISAAIQENAAGVEKLHSVASII